MTTASRFLLLCSTLALCSCGVVQKPLQPVLKERVSHIALAKIDTQNLLLIRQVNPAVAIMGTSGLVMDAAILAQRAREYEHRAGPVNDTGINLFEQALKSSLTARGITVSSSDKGYWDLIRMSKTKQHSTPILHIEFKHLGFWSEGMMYPYRPAILVTTKLVDPVSRKVLYNDRIAMGIDITSLQILELSYGKINALPVERKSAYKDFHALLKQSSQSREALLALVSRAASHIAKGLRGESRYIARAYAKTAARKQAATSDDLIVDVHVANVRNAPETGGKIIRRLKKGEVATRLRKQNDWFYILLKDGTYAWAHESVFLDRGASPKAERTQRFSDRNRLVVRARYAEIRNAPAKNATVFDRLKKGSVVNKMRQQGEWYYVMLGNGRHAWAHHSAF